MNNSSSLFATDGFKRYHDSYMENPDAFTYGTEVEVKNNADGVITHGKFTEHAFGEDTFEIEDSKKIKKIFNTKNNDILIKIINVSKYRPTGPARFGGKKTTRRQSTRRQSTRRKSTRRKSTRRKSTKY